MRFYIIIGDILSIFMRLIPYFLLLPIRDSFFKSRQNTFKNKFLYFLLEIIATKKLNLDVITLPDDPTIKFKNNNSYIFRRLYWLGQNGFEPSESKWWKNFCQNATGVLEIGANIGYYTTIGSKNFSGKKYVAVEPHPISVNTLRTNLKLNKLGSVDVIEAAVVGKKTGEKMDLMIPDQDRDESPTEAYLKIGTEGIEKSAKKSISVKLIESRELINGIDLIKIDAEGSEADIISSIKDFIFSNRPILFVEILENTPLLRKLIIELIRKCNYQVYVIGHQLHLVSEQEISNISFYQKYKIRDVILSPHSLPSSSV